ncbi:MAG: isoprenyl transferase [Bacteroidetes bacterium]|nr:isoprenyl transferase [Bacteroidota bacterium]
MSFKEKLIKEKLPKHVAVIMDGNGRWAKKRGKARIFGHKKGVETVHKIVEAAGEIGIEYLTLYAFSTENWNRPKDEVDSLMMLLVSTIKSEFNTLIKNNVRLLTIGNLDDVPKKVNKKIIETVEKTKNNTGLKLIIALSYSSRWEIVNAVKNIGYQIQQNNIMIEDINNELFNKFLTTSQIPDPELLIRTSGEYRLSNFLLWQIAYSELYFTKKLWPEFEKEDFYEAINNFQNRERRFGKTSEQIH